MATFVDALDRRLEIQAPPRRIVSLVPSITEMLFAFGLGEAVVGVTKFCVEPRDAVAAKPKVGGTKTLDLPRLRALAPDLVIANAEENTREQIGQLQTAGIRVYVTFPRTVAGAIEMMGELARITGALESALPLIEASQRALDDARSAARDRRPVRVFCPIWRSPPRGARSATWMTIGADTYMHDVIATCGGANVFADSDERYPRLDLEEMARRDPEVILLPDEPYRFRDRHLPELARFRNVSAVREGRLHLLDGKHLSWYGPRIADSLPILQRLLQRKRELLQKRSPPPFW